MQADDLVLVSGMRSTRATLREWNDDGGKVLGLWLVGALAVSVLLLFAIWLVATIVTPDPDFYTLPSQDLQLRRHRAVPQRPRALVLRQAPSEQ